MEINKVYVIIPMCVILGMLLVITYNLFKESKRKLLEDERESNLPKFLIDNGIKQFDLMVDEKYKKDRIDRSGIKWSEYKVNHDLFVLMCTTLPAVFSNSLLAKNHWYMFVIDYNVEQGWYDIELKRRHYDTVKIRLHYFDITTFNEGCNKIIGYDNSELIGTIKTITKKQGDVLKEIKGND